MTPDEAREIVLYALADLPSGPPSEEILAILLAAVWDEGNRNGYRQRACEQDKAGRYPDATFDADNPYRANE